MHLKNTISNIKSNFTLSNKFKKTLFLDTLFYFSLLILFYLMLFISNPFIDKIGNSVNQIDLTNHASVSSVNSTMISSTLYLIGILILFTLLTIILFTYFKGKIWSVLLNKKLSKLNYSNLFILYLLILVPEFIFLLILAFFTSQNLPIYIFSFLGFFLIFTYLNNLITINFITKKNIFLSIIKGFKDGFTKFTRLILICLFSLSLFILLNLFFSLFSLNDLSYIRFISPFLLILWAVWSRILFVHAYKT
jgi:hypothetical protein